MNNKKDSIWMGISIAFLLMLSISFLLMLPEDDSSIVEKSVFMFVSGGMFWVSSIMLVISQIVLSRQRKKWYAVNKVRKDIGSRRLGVISFFSNTLATVADIISVLSLVGLVIAMVASKGGGYICFVLISIFVFSFGMHCILNGRVYYFVTNKKKLLKYIEANN